MKSWALSWTYWCYNFCLNKFCPGLQLKLIYKLFKLYVERKQIGEFQVTGRLVKTFQEIILFFAQIISCNLAWKILTGTWHANIYSWTLTFWKSLFYLLQRKPLKMIKNAFYFILKPLFILKIFKFFVLTFLIMWENGLILKFLKSQPGK